MNIILQGRVKFPTGGKVREPKGRSVEITEPTVESGWEKKKELPSI